MQTATIITVVLVALTGCTTPPGVGQREPDGNPVVQRLTAVEWAQIGPEAPVRLSVPTIVTLSQAGVSPGEIIRRYYQTGTRLKLTGVQLAELRKDGVDQRVLDYIASAEQHAARTDAITAQADQAAQARLWYDRSLYAAGWGGYPGWSYPGPGVFPYAGYGSSRLGSGWYGGVAIGF